MSKSTAHVHLGWLLARPTRASQHAPRPTWSVVSWAPRGWMGVRRVLPVGVVGCRWLPKSSFPVLVLPLKFPRQPVQ